MEHTIYFADKFITFSHLRPDPSTFSGAVVECDGMMSRAKLLKILETENSICVISASPAASFKGFASEFWAVEAAGGVAINPRGEWLMIYRNSRWDLPKGHIELGESPEVAALRETEEETGVHNLEIGRFLCHTHHAYLFPKTLRWELKRTHWFAMRTSDESTLVPQIEEGIERVEWSSPAQVVENLRASFPTIRYVASKVF